MSDKITPQPPVPQHPRLPVPPPPEDISQQTTVTFAGPFDDDSSTAVVKE